MTRWLFAIVVLVLWGLDTHGTFAGSGDEPHYAMIAHSVAFDRDFDLANDYADPATLVGGGTLTPGAHAVPGKGGTLRPVHDVGLPVVSAPFFAAAYAIAEHSTHWMSPTLMARARLTPALVLRHLLSLGMILVTGCLAIVLFRIFGSLGGTDRLAFIWTLVCVLSPPILSHSFLFFTEIPTALLVAVLFRESLSTVAPTVRRAAMRGVLVGLLLILHVRNVGLVAALTALFLIDALRARNAKVHAVSFVSAVAAFLMVRSALTLHFWGTLVTTPIVAPAAPHGAAATLAEIGTRMGGLLFDQEHGLLMYAPVYLLALPGALILRRTSRRASNVALLLAAAYVIPVLLPFVNPNGWSGGWSPAARFVVPIAPLLGVFAFGLIAPHRNMPKGVAFLILVQAALDALFWSHPKLLWNDGTGRSALAEFFSRAGDVAGWLPSWHRPTTYGVTASIVALVAWIAVSERAATIAARSYDLRSRRD